MKDTSDSKPKGETADNHRTRLMATAPHLARKLQPKPPGFRDVREMKTTHEANRNPKVKGARHHD